MIQSLYPNRCRWRSKSGYLKAVRIRGANIGLFSGSLLPIKPHQQTTLTISARKI
ncbi:hypothetical protein HMPREF9371_2416 [Neisseria shayeganii 871]|uniref:Uncharacterized protein n=1 Tax=Neisseria shayeganii 871 TaxID=1032488 RepID=G4CLC5_9NEIS|nr:hypothetical protein HMPREF9371_2416 [Neisseria shayeganii 871]